MSDNHRVTQNRPLTRAFPATAAAAALSLALGVGALAVVGPASIGQAAPRAVSAAQSAATELAAVAAAERARTATEQVRVQAARARAAEAARGARLQAAQARAAAQAATRQAARLQAARLQAEKPQAAREATQLAASPTRATSGTGTSRTSAPAHVRASRPIAETPQQRGARLLAVLNYPYEKLGYRIEFLAPRSGYLAVTFPDRRLIQVYVRGTDVVLKHTIAHEIGHALDFERNTASEHQSYLGIRGLPATSRWYGCSMCSDYATPAGDWAEVFAYWLAGPGDFRSRMAGPPSRAQLVALQRFFTAA